MRSPLLPIGINSVLPIGLFFGGVQGLFLCPPTITAFVAAYPAIASIVTDHPDLAVSDEYAELISLISEDAAIASLLPALPLVQSDSYYPDLVSVTVEAAIASTIISLPALAGKAAEVSLSAIAPTVPAIESAVAETQVDKEECEC